MKLNGAQIIVECLKEQDVKYVFGYPGAATINIYDELYKTNEIEHILTSHEQGASHAADGYARATGEVGVCLATSGPGATNLVTGIATAFMDSVPMVAFTGNVNIENVGNDSFQEVDTFGITMPIVKHNYMVKDIKILKDVIREAFTIARSGRPGPVLIDIPKNLTVEIDEYEYKEPKKEIEIIKPTIKTNIVDLINKAKRPMVVAGGGVIISRATKELISFSEKINAKVACTLMGLGGMPYSHPNYTGNIGMHGSMVSNKAINNADLVIAIGSRFSDRVVGKLSDFAKNAKFIHIDIDPAEINKSIIIDEYINGDAKYILSELTKLVDTKENKDWDELIEKLRITVGHKIDKSYINAPFMIKEIAKYQTEDDVVVTDVGQHQMWTAQHYPVEKPNRFLSSGGLGTMGYALGAAIGAQFACPSNRVVMITGDGSFRMNFNEIITAVRNKLPIKIFIMNNNALGMVRQWQNLFYDKRFSATTLEEDIDYIGLAKSLGGQGYNIKDVKEVKATLDDVMNNDKLCVVNCLCRQDMNVYPMVAPGKAIHEALTEDK